MNKRFLSTLLLVIVITLIYFAAGRLGLALASLHLSVSPVWPPAGIALAVCLLLGYWVWPGIFLGAFLVNVTTSGAIVGSLGIAVGNTLAALLGTYLINRFAEGRFVFKRARTIFIFTLLIPVSAIVSATFGATSLVLSGLATSMEYLPIWFTWWLGDAAGTLIVSPPLILWVTERSLPWNRRWVEAAVILLLVIGVSLAVFGGLAQFGIPNLPIGFSLIPLIVWAGFRLGSTGVSTLTLVLSGIAIGGTLLGYGPYMRGTQNATLLLLQGFMGTLSITGLTMAAVVDERQRAAESLTTSHNQLAALASDNARLYLEAQVSNVELENRVHQRTLALELSQAEARALSNRLLTAREEERAEMAREIHDQLGQNLTVLKMDLVHIRETVHPFASDDLLSRIQATLALTDETAQMIRHLAARLRPSILDDFGLLAALEWQLEEIQTRTGITFRLNSAVENLDLKPECTTALFRICQEALTNVVRHARATVVEISLTLQNGYLVTQIQDNGRGISEQQLGNNQTFGLLGMRERVRLIGGELDIKGIPMQGTAITVTIPWEERDQPAG